MSLINEMLKDLEKRRSRDLETSSSLNENITWETRPNKKNFNWIAFLSIVILIGLTSVIGYLLWERNATTSATVVTGNTHAVVTQKKKIVKPIAKRKTIEKIKKPVEEVIVEDEISEAIDIEAEAIDIEEAEELPLVKLKKTHRPLNSKQLEEIAYK